MTPSHRLCRAAMFGMALGVAACDVYEFATDPLPSVVQTWNLPMPGNRISVGQLLPDSIGIFSTPASNPPDSSAFAVTMGDVNFASQPIGQHCAACQSLNGTTSIKPAFNFTVGNARGLPSDVVSGALVNGSLDYTVTNNLSFDPIRVSQTPGNPNGFMVILITSAQGLVLARDTVKGDVTPLPANTSLTRTVPLSTGNVTGQIRVDMEINSPIGDHTVPIDANRTMGVQASISSLRLGTVTINVPNIAIPASAPSDIDMDIEGGITDRILGGEVDMSITNPFPITGNVNVNLVYGPQPADLVTKAITLPASTATPTVRTIALTQAEIKRVLCGAPTPSDDCPKTTPTTMTVTGGLTSSVPVTFTPKQQVSIANRLRIQIRVGGN